MKQKTYMTISEFGRLTGIKRANLIFYDKIGLLSPDFRGDNDYRYYSKQQLGSAYLILTLRELGMNLDTIRRYARERTPEKMLLLFEEQKKKIDQEILRLRRTKDILGMYADMAQEGILWSTDEVLLQEKKKEPVFLGSPSSQPKTDDEKSIDFFLYASDAGMDLGYPLGCIIEKQALEAFLHKKQQTGYTATADYPENNVYRYYFKVNQGHNAFKPQGLYAVTCGFCGYGETHFLYERLIQFIGEKGLQICGDAYEESLLNEMAIIEDSRYLFKVEIPVRERSLS